MSARNDVVNIKTCLGTGIMFSHFAKVSAPNRNIFGRTFFRPHPLTYQIFGTHEPPQTDQVGHVTCNFVHLGKKLH